MLQVEDMTTAQLEAWRDHIEAELFRRELELRETSGREVVGPVLHTPVGTMREEFVDCGKDRCKKCDNGPSHGPYWYLYYRKDGRLVSKYVGKFNDRNDAVDKAESIRR